MTEKKDSPYIILFAVCAAQFFMPFMVAGVNSILPPLGKSTGASAHELSLVITFYVLGLATSQLITGRMGDIWGRRRIFLLGSAIFVMTNIGMGFLENIHAIQALRLLQGLGTAMFSASGLAILAVSAPQGKRSTFVAYSATAIYAGIACGPPVAGFIAEHYGWPWLFWGSAIAGIITWLFMRFAVHEEWYQGKGEPFNWLDAGMYALGMACIAFGSSVIKTYLLGGGACIAFGLVLLTIYIRLELRAPFPLLDVRLLGKNKVFALSSLAAFINYSASFGMTLFFSLYLQVVKGMTVGQAGLMLSLQFVVQALASPFSGRLIPKYGGGPVSAVGIAFCGVGLLASAFLTEQSSLIFFFAAQACLGLGLGLFAAPNTTVILESVDKAHMGQAASVVGTMRTVGALVNTAIISITLGYFLGDAQVSTENIDAFLQSMRVDLIIFGALNILAIGLAWSRQKNLRQNSGA